jgi:hypothetical protein
VVTEVLDEEGDRTRGHAVTLSLGEDEPGRPDSLPDPPPHGLSKHVGSECCGAGGDAIAEIELSVAEIVTTAPFGPFA